MPGVLAATAGDQFAVMRRGALLQLVAHAEHGEGGMVAVGGQDAVDLGGDEAVAGGVGADVGAGRLDLEEEAGPVGRGEGRLGRAPGMETHVVQAVGAGRCRRCASQAASSMGGYPVSGKMQHSSVPRSMIGRPLRVNCFPTMPRERMPKEVVCVHVSDPCRPVAARLAVSVCTLGENSSHNCSWVAHREFELQAPSGLPER